MNPRPCLALLLALASSTSAQGGPQPPPDDYVPFEHTIEMPAGLGAPGPFQDVALGEFAGDRITSAVVLDGGELIVVHAPAMMKSVTQLTEASPGVTAVATLPSNDGLCDYLLTASSVGLERLDFDRATGTWSKVALGSSIWANARRLVVAKVDDQVPGDDIVGLSADGSAVLTLMSDGLGGFAPETSHALPANADDIVVYDHDDDADLEVAVRDEDALPPADAYLRIYHHDDFTAAISAIRLAFPGGALARLDSDGVPETLAWIVRSGNDDMWFLFLYNSAELVGPLPLLLPVPEYQDPVVLDPIGLSAGDYDGDGLADLIISDKAIRRAVVLLNQGTPGVDDQFSLNTGEFLTFDLATLGYFPATENEVRPGFGFLNDGDLGDGSADIFFPAENAQAFEVISGGIGTYAGEALNPGFLGDCALYADPQSSGALFELVLQDILPAVVGTYTHLQVMIWKQEDPTPPPAPYLGAIAVSNDIYTLSLHEGQLSPNHWVRIEIDEQTDSIPDPEVSGSIWPQQGHYYATYRLIETDGPGDPITRASAMFAAGFILPENATEATGVDYTGYLITLPGAGPPLPLRDLPFGTHGGNGRVGTIVTESVLPSFAPGAYPSWPVLTEEGQTSTFD